MPVYQYQCTCCNHEFDVKQSFTDESTASCPKCHNGARRLFKPVPIIFKGSGFYVTDHARKSEAQESPKSTPKDNSNSTTKSDTKDSSKAEKKDESKVEKKEEKAV